ncbi:MAG: substrate-binding domain-containing protein, partial [Candidatus Solibacter usitatus]|nr:substrate-binding domain-containing protein [Candidatus Solibacter usitatus]
SGKNRTLGLIVSNLENPFFVDVIHSMEEEARARGYELLVANTGYDPERLKACVRLMIGRRLGGLALVVSEMDAELLDELAERQVPTAVYDVGTPRESLINIRVNYRKAMQRIAEYLHSLGHRRLAFIGHHPSLGPLNDRRQTFVEVMEHFAPHVEFRAVADSDGFEGGRRAARALLSGGFTPTAIVCVNDFMAAGVLRELRAYGLRVPLDVSVTGFDNIALADVVTPPLTTAHIARDLIGRWMFQTITAENALASTGREILLEAELIIRDSTGPAPA